MSSPMRVVSASACPGEVDPVRRQGHAPTVESTALPGHIGSNMTGKRCRAACWAIPAMPGLVALLSVGGCLKRFWMPPRYRPDIDGLRAFAVMAVILFHTFPNMLPGGFVGVDI